jgi:uncharacterized iron-regulated membrane protein|tara:strand:- start:2239 stop:2541 length:303 start_codon:yes stop_codon:yes gene_type:complete
VDPFNGNILYDYAKKDNFYGVASMVIVARRVRRKTTDASTENLATRIWNFKYSFHTGSFFGIGLKFFWILLALSPAAFAITELWLFIKRTQRNKPMRVTT